MRRLLAAVLIFAAVFSLRGYCGDAFDVPDTAAVVSAADKAPGVSAECCVLLEADSGQVICASNGEKTAQPASLTKIMTAYLVIKSVPLTDKVTVPAAATGVEGSSVYLRTGEVLTVEELLYAVLLESANDASVTLALYVAGSPEAFVKTMNDTAFSLGMFNTHFVNPHGLPAEGHYSTAHDMARLLCAAMKNADFARISSTCKYLLRGSDERTARLFVNHNRLLCSCEGVVGGKTGYTKSAGRCLASYCVRDGVSLCAVTFNAPSDWSDHEKLYAFGYTLYSRFTLDCAGVYTLHVCGGVTDSVCCTVNENFELTLRHGGGEIEKHVYMRRFDFAPIASGQKIGTVVFTRDGKVIYELTLYADESVRRFKSGWWR